MSNNKEYIPEDLEDARIYALALHLISEDNVEFDEEYTLEEFLTEITHEYSNTFSHYNCDYLVATDGEAEDEWDEYMDNYIEECVLDQLPECYQCYFDSEKFKQDASYDGRGHALNSYDGREYEEQVTYGGNLDASEATTETFYIYQR